MGMRYFGGDPQNENAQTPKLQFGKTTVYILRQPGGTCFRPIHTQLSNFTTFGYPEAPSVNASILLGMTWPHSSELRLLWASIGPRVPIAGEPASETT